MITPTVTPGYPLVVEQTRYDKHGDPFVIREYEARDYIVLQRFYEAFEPKRVAQGLPPAEPDRIRSWLTILLSSGVHLVAYRGDDLIGHGLVMPTDRAGVGEYAVFLREDVRDRGIGTRLNAAVIEAARASGLRGLWLTVEPQNRAAIGSYEKVGFRFVGNTMFSLEVEMELVL
jgi:ribosomal protein S18 acetylase RimI-like enzyme